MRRHCRRRFLEFLAAAAFGACARAGSPGAAAESRSAMRFAICNETFGDWPFDRAFGLAAECGYTGIEIAPFTLADDVRDISAAKRTEVRRLAEKSGLHVIGLHWLLARTKGLHLTSPDATVRRKTAEYLGELARFCADLGGTLLVFGSPKQRDLAPGMDRAEGMRHAAEVFRATLPVFEKTETILAIEPLAPQTTNFITTAAEGEELVRAVDSPRCRLHLDCKAMVTERTPVADLVRQHRAQLVHFHANDDNGQGPGFGKLDFVPIFRALCEIGYRGWVSVEVFDLAPGAERTARQSIAHMKKCLARACAADSAPAVSSQ
ncbi:MAG: sugar phosphate isomerase/epimerase [Thermoguttaceae bacterium]|nr:sugar phosphate isomerase/epimerase [Thermoguttaceae bacterium]